MEKLDSLSLFNEKVFLERRLWGPYPQYPLVSKYIAPVYKKPIIVAGPCSVENPEQIEIIAKELGSLDVGYLRGGCFRAGTYPSNSTRFGWIPEKDISEFSRAAVDYGMKCVIEVLDYYPESLRMIDKYCHVYQVGARQMQNYTLLKILSKKKRPVFLKRNMGSTLDEWLGSAEWLLKDGHCQPFLIERGSSTHMNHVRWDLSLSAVAAVKKMTSIPVLVDSSHGTGRRDLVRDMALAGIAAGADGVLIETHPNPSKSISDSDQAYPLELVGDLIHEIRDLYAFIHKKKKTISYDSEKSNSTI